MSKGDIDVGVGLGYVAGMLLCELMRSISISTSWFINYQAGQQASHCPLVSPPTSVAVAAFSLILTLPCLFHLFVSFSVSQVVLSLSFPLALSVFVSFFLFVSFSLYIC